MSIHYWKSIGFLFTSQGCFLESITGCGELSHLIDCGMLSIMEILESNHLCSILAGAELMQTINLSIHRNNTLSQFQLVKNCHQFKYGLCQLTLSDLFPHQNWHQQYFLQPLSASGRGFERLISAFLPMILALQMPKFWSLTCFSLKFILILKDSDRWSGFSFCDSHGIIFIWVSFNVPAGCTQVENRQC